MADAVECVECVECPTDDVAKLEKAEAEVALDEASTSGTGFYGRLNQTHADSCCAGGKRAATPIQSAESKKPRIDGGKDIGAEHESVVVT